MNKLFLIGVGLATGYILFKRKGYLNIVGVGDKGKQIEGMQHALERLSGIKFQEYGVYDKDTQIAVQYLMRGTTAMRNVRGDLDKNFVNDLSVIYSNTLKN